MSTVPDTDDPAYARFFGEGPLNDIERSIAEIWSSALNEPNITRSVNFLDVGGDSLSAALVLARLRREFGVTVTIREFLSAPTVAALAEFVTQRAH